MRNVANDMRVSKWSRLGFVGLLALAACGGGAATGGPPTTAEGKPAGGETADLPKWKLGHYSSPDGLQQLVVDRTGDKPKVQLQGSTDVVELFLEEAFDRGDSQGHWLNGPDGKHWMFLDKDGGLSFIKAESRELEDLRHRSGFLALSRDADAKPLGAATKVGIATPPKPKTPNEQWLEKLAASSVVAKMPQFKPEDSGNLAKVAEALQKADPSTFVHTTAKAGEAARWEPASSLIGNTEHAGGGGILIQGRSDKKWDKKGSGIAKYGLEFHAKPNYGDPSRIRQFQLEGFPSQLAENTPGVVWSVNDSTIVFVSLDGGRYQINGWSNTFDKDGPVVAPGAGAPASWPAPLQHSTVDAGVVSMWLKANAVDKKVADEVLAAEDAYFQCVNKVWKEGRDEQEKLEASQASAPDKFGKLSGVRKKYELKAEKDCAGTVKKYDDTLVKFIEARDKERAAIFEKAKARVK